MPECRLQLNRKPRDPGYGLRPYLALGGISVNWDKIFQLIGMAGFYL